MIDKKEFSAKNLDVAILAAADHFKVSVDQIEAKQVDEKKGFLGLGKKVVIEASIKSNVIKEKNSEKEKISHKKEKNVENNVVLENFDSNNPYFELVNYLKTIISHFDLVANIDITEKANKVYINIDTENNSILIGKSGATLNALNGVVKQIGNKFNNFEERKDFIVDVGNYKKERVVKLESLATSIGQKVIKYGKSINMKPMNAFERRIVHATLSKMENVETVSVGQEPKRYIIVKPA